MNPKLTRTANRAIILAWTVMMTAHAGDNLTPADIFKKAQEKYASLTSYSDEGRTVASLNGMTFTTTFSIKLARPNLYQIAWNQVSAPSFAPAAAKPKAVWSAGHGDFLDMGRGTEKQTSQEMALAAATGISGGAAANIPGTFFKMAWGNQLAVFSNDKPQSDEKIGDVDCYVFTHKFKGMGRTLWIGKQDFLIHQIQNVTSAEAMKATMDQAAKSDPNASHVPTIEPKGLTSIETHINIVENPKFTEADFSH